MKAILALLLLAISSYSQQSTLWARCVYNNAVLPCKLVGDKVYINGKSRDIQMVDVISIDGVINILVKDNK